MAAAAATTADPTRSRRPLAELIANRRWVRRARPFPHVVASNVFVADFATQLGAEFARIEREHPEAFRRNMTGYDASGADLGRYQDGPLAVFVSREWHDLIAGVAGVRATGDVSASVHHHDPNSAGGWPHNDLNPGWYADPAPAPGHVRLAGTDGVDYHRGTRPAGVSARETIRAVSVLFYLGNPAWEPGDGGETGLWDSPHSAGPSAAVPPVNNSLVLFECTPCSWHGYLANNAKPRNSVVMWLHRPKADVVARWGEPSIVRW
jgi:2OG-Fe(II) oxygenase superfamily